MEGDGSDLAEHSRQAISIHSLRMEGDRRLSLFSRRKNIFQSTPSAWRETMLFLFFMFFLLISIHSLRMEGDAVDRQAVIMRQRFQSTPSAWRETHAISSHCTADGYFNPLPPHGGRRKNQRFIKILATFQSTPSAWRETVLCGK